jgi:hypothetical protein
MHACYQQQYGKNDFHGANFYKGNWFEARPVILEGNRRTDEQGFINAEE